MNKRHHSPREWDHKSTTLKYYYQEVEVDVIKGKYHFKFAWIAKDEIVIAESQCQTEQGAPFVSVTNRLQQRTRSTQTKQSTYRLC